MDDLITARVYRAWGPIAPSSIEDLFGGDLEISASYVDPEAIIGEGLFVVLVG